MTQTPSQEPAGPPPSAPTAPDDSRQRWIDRGVVMGLAALLFLPMLGQFGLWDPWETHYGEVGRQLTERHDWISSWWGSLWRDGNGNQEGRFFFSKPIFLMWTMALGLEVFGFSEWGIRLGTALIAILGVGLAYSMGERIWGRRVGFIMAGVLATSPFFFFLSNQAQTDMPFVGNMTIGLCFFMMAVFGRDREQAASRPAVAMTGAFVLLTVVPQLVLIFQGLGHWRAEEYGQVGAFFVWGPFQAVAYGLMVAVVGWTMLRKGAWPVNRQLHLMCFYVFLGLASLSKGLLGFALPGAFIFFYLLLTGEWRRLREMEIPRGVLLFIAASFPWYVAMLVRHGNAYFQRFFIHDHFKRLATGVHQIDSGSFEHYVKWLGYGMWPWASFLPAALVRVFAGHHLAPEQPEAPRDDRQRATLFLVLWFVFTFTLFTLSSTKFHHYIFPAVPAAAFLVGLLLDDLWSAGRRARLSWVLYLSAATLLVFVGWDLVDDPQHLKNLFTYKYDRKWHMPWNGPFQLKMGLILAVACVGATLVAMRRVRWRRAGVGLVAAAATLMTAFCLWDYMPTVADTWSQKGVWDLYYERCTRTEGPPGHDAKKRYCAEQAISYKLNWRGETFYTQNEVIPVSEDDDFEHFLKQNGQKRFYAIMEYSRYHGEFQRKLPASLKGKTCMLETNNIKFTLAEVPCDRSRGKVLERAPEGSALEPENP